MVEGRQTEMSSHLFSHSCSDVCVPCSSPQKEKEAVRQQVEFGRRRRLCKYQSCLSLREKSHGRAGSTSFTRGMTVPFYLFLPSGIQGVIEIIYQLMWADGLIKQNRKTFEAGPECVTHSGMGHWELPARCVLALCRVSSSVPRHRGAGCPAWEFRILTWEAGSSCAFCQSSPGRSQLPL